MEYTGVLHSVTQANESHGSVSFKQRWALTNVPNRFPFNRDRTTQLNVEVYIAIIDLIEGKNAQI